MEFIDLKTPFLKMKPEIMARIEKVLDHGQYIMGPEVEELETVLKQYVGTKYCITVASGTEALLISLMALDIGVGDEVITTPFSFIATAEVIALLGATPVFVDINPETCNIDANLIEQAVTPQTKAIMPVSLYGQPADMNKINEIADKYHLPVIEDAAQSFGATYHGKKSCNLSTIGCTSFFPSKPLGCYGDGGAIFTNDDALANSCKEIRVHGQEARYQHRQIGVGGRMDTIQCAVLLEKMKYFDAEIQSRYAAAQRYNDRLIDLEKVGALKLVKVRPDVSSVYAQYTMLVENRDECIQVLKEKGIPTAVHYPIPMHLQQALEGKTRFTKLPNAEQAAKQVFSLPMHAYLTHDIQDYVANAILRFVMGEL